MMVLLVVLLLVVEPIVSDFIAPGREFKYAANVVLVGRQTKYIPMGRNLLLDCQAAHEVEHNGYSTLKVLWTWKGPKGKIRIEKQNVLFQKRIFEADGQLIIYVVQSQNEGWYDCHVYANDSREWISRHYLIVQDCRLMGNATLSLNPRDPCKFGQCTVRRYSDISNYSYLYCKCIKQYTGEYCHKENTGRSCRKSFQEPQQWIHGYYSDEYGSQIIQKQCLIFNCCTSISFLMDRCAIMDEYE